jgi:hypothetical protein
MADNDEQTPENPPQQEENAQDQGVSTDQWRQFLGNLAAQNQALQAQLASTQNAFVQQNVAQRRQQINQLPPEQKAEMLERELNSIQANAEAAQQQQISTQVWQQRDAESAARILKINGLSGYEPELYRANWDVNWMPRFVASVENLVSSRQKQGNSAAASNPANRANIGSGRESNIPELDPNASGYETIRYALSRQRS